MIPYVEFHARSAFSFLRGGSAPEALAKALCASSTWRIEVRRAVADYGYCVSPDDCYLALRGFRTIGVRMKQQMENALKEVNRPSKGVFLSGLSAGLNLSFGALFMAMVLTFAGGFDSALTRQSALAGISAIAFLFVVLAVVAEQSAHVTDVMEQHGDHGLQPGSGAQIAVAELPAASVVVTLASMLLSATRSAVVTAML